MSTASKANDTYLQHVSLKNYKSIKDVEINFKPGLNVIIGKNASGKTNFINGLDRILSYEYNELLASEFSIKALFKHNEISIKAFNSIKPTSEFIVTSHHSFFKNKDLILEINGDKINDNEKGGIPYAPIYAFSEKGFYFDKVLIKYGVSYKVTDSFINIPFSFTFINNGKVSGDLMLFIMSDNQTKFIASFMEHFNKFLYEVFYDEDKILNNEIDIKREVISFSEKYFSYFNLMISQYSPIQAIRVNPDFNVIKEENGFKQTITNFYLEFLIDKSWLIFNLLSDGTKRLFYIISEILGTYNSTELYNDELNIVLLEEPELGIHPHQLHQLMQFIKEQSREKQIIITTHSPQVLDILEPDQLDRIIICHYDSSNGTQLSHLSEKEIKKAKKYIQEEAFLSDYWRFSDLEPAS